MIRYGDLRRIVMASCRIAAAFLITIQFFSACDSNTTEPLPPDTGTSPRIQVNPTPLSEIIDEEYECTWDVTVSNFGSASLHIFSIISDSPWLAITPDDSCVIEPDDSLLIHITVDAYQLVTGNHEARVTIQSDDPDFGTYLIPVTVYVIEQAYPEISIQPQSLELELEANETVNERFQVINNGAVPLIVSTIQSGSPWMTIQGSESFSIDPYYFHFVTVEISSTGLLVGDHTGVLSIHSNASNIAELTLPVSLTVTLPPEGSLFWESQAFNRIYSSAAIGSVGEIYVGADDGYLYAFDQVGTRLWRFPTSGPIASSPAVVNDGTIYFGSDDGCVYGVDPNGTLKWLYQTGGYIPSSPAIGSDGTIYIGSDDSFLYALQPNGTLAWRFETNGPVVSSPAINESGTIFFGSYDHRLYSLSPNGDELWTFETGDEIISSPAIGADGTIYIGSEDGLMYAVNTDGSMAWSYDTGDPVTSSPCIGLNGTVYVGSSNGYLYAFSNGGYVDWRYRADGPISSSPMIDSSGRIYVADENGSFHVIDDRGLLVWDRQFDAKIAASPAMTPNDYVIISAWDGSIYAISTYISELADSPWPKFRHDSRGTGNINTP